MLRLGRSCTRLDKWEMMKWNRTKGVRVGVVKHEDEDLVVQGKVGQ